MTRHRRGNKSSRPNRQHNQRKQKRRFGHSRGQHHGQGQQNKQSDDYNTYTRNEDTNSLTLAISVVIRPPLPLPPQLPLRGFATVLHITPAETLTDVRQAPSASVTVDGGSAPPARPPPALPGKKTLISHDARVPGSPSAQRRPAPVSPRALPRASDRCSDSASLFHRGYPGRPPWRRDPAPQTRQVRRRASFIAGVETCAIENEGEEGGERRGGGGCTHYHAWP